MSSNSFFTNFIKLDCVYDVKDDSMLKNQDTRLGVSWERRGYLEKALHRAFFCGKFSPLLIIAPIPL